jgi:glutathione synthase/RimK-type ligase-like ATP-grasp enzyme
MTRVALATCRQLPHLDDDEAPLMRALEARGVPYVVAPWDGGDAPFVDSGLTVIRSTWDYTDRLEDFLAWADRIEAAGRLENRARIVRWNTHKSYLLELAREGVAVVPTVLLEKGSTASLRGVLEERGFIKGAVVKPAVSAGSRDTLRVRGLDTAWIAEGQALLAARLPERDMLVQPFVEGIEGGELSLIYIDGAFSHAVNKRPRRDDFRSQPEFGSRVERVEPQQLERAAAEEILRIVGGPLLYARVDFVTGDDGRPWLMELELVEPSLYLGQDEAAAPKLAAAIARRLGHG